MKKNIAIIGCVLNDEAQAALVLNKVFVLPADGWFHTVPLGEFPGSLRKPDGSAEQVLQVINKDSLDAIIEAFRTDAVAGFPGLLVDLEHNSDSGRMDSDTRAAAWIKDVEARADGIWCKFELTDLGRELIGGGVYRFQSPTLDVAALDAGRVQPVRLAKSTLTNTPNFRRGLRPLANKETSADAAVQQKEANTMEPKAMLLKLLAALGKEVPADANDETLGQMCDKAIADMSAEKTGKEADTFIAENEGKIANKESFRAAFILNPEAAKQIVAAIKVPKAEGVTLNKGEAPVPPVAGSVDNKADRDAFVSETATKFKLTGGAAVAKAQLLKPELWK